MAKKKQNRFAGRTARSMERPKFNYGYLKLPDDVNIFKPEGGTEIVIDILPYIVTDENHLDNRKYPDDAVVGDMWWKRPIRVHRDVGPDNATVVCPTTFGDKCPICEDANRQKKDGVEWEELREIFPKNRSIFYVVPVNTDECELDYQDGEVHIMDASDHTFLQNLEEEVLRDIDNEGFPDPEDGMSLKLYFKTKKLGKNKYAELSKVDFVERDTQYDEDFVKELQSLDEILEVHDYKTLQSMYFGMEGLDESDLDETPFAEDTDEEPEETPKRTRKPKETKPKEETAPKPKPKRERKPTPKETNKECPHKLKFGEDFDQYDVCDKCEVWEDCKEANADLNK